MTQTKLLKKCYKDDLPREKLISKGAANLKDFELLALLLRTGSRTQDVLQVSQDILSHYSLADLLTVSIEQLQEITGIGSSKAAALLASFELTKRALNNHADLLPIIHKPADAIPLISYLRDKKKEYLVALFLNSRNQVLHCEEISVGTLTASLVHPRELFSPAIEKTAAGILLVHNHPSGDPEPSREDIAVTKRLYAAGKLLGIELMDHLIITKYALTSLQEKGIFSSLEKGNN